MTNYEEYADRVAPGHFNRVMRFRKELTKETDRGCALMTAAFLDESLKRLLEANTVDDKKTFENLCIGTGGMATFSAKIEFCYLLGLISAETRRLLNIIRKIRNEFAHSMEILSFDTEDISNRCRSLHSKVISDTPFSPRVVFVSISYRIAGLIDGQTIISRRPTNSDDEFGADAFAKHQKYMEHEGKQVLELLIEKYYKKDPE
ncbi:transcriptional regulator [Paenibacillus xylanexedens]|uniref:transcriptional regulator n=1 Tax=Paenibacillus xylanexedens TaxID=528191 RepID=UPI0011A96825|nr:transcriptional regulator [Paenibacillus xylanexedens]